jgi:hypothetical protein
MPAQPHQPDTFTVELDAVDLPELDLRGDDRPSAATAPRPKHHKDRERSTVGSRGVKVVPQAKRYAFRRS